MHALFFVRHDNTSAQSIAIARGQQMLRRIAQHFAKRSDIAALASQQVGLVAPPAPRGIATIGRFDQRMERGQDVGVAGSRCMPPTYGAKCGHESARPDYCLDGRFVPALKSVIPAVATD